MPDALAVDPALRQRRRLRVRGLVQGVGFRPFVYRLAVRAGLAGFVRNDGSGVTIEIEGAGGAVAEFQRALQAEAPGAARVEAIDAQLLEATGESAFAILTSAASVPATMIGPDTAPCPQCLEELFAPQSRRWRHAFINCTQCGPRFTLSRALPYDRAQTSMAAFAMCEHCAAEYADPRDRRFHAEPNACPQCGPRLSLLDAQGTVRHEDPLAGVLRRLREGAIVAIKGLGGFHLACDARNAAAVARLRARKQRPRQPFALMVAGCASIDEHAQRSVEADIELRRPARPIVLLDRRPDSERSLAGAAPALNQLGFMLPSSPLHYLLFHEAAGRPAGCDWLEQPQALVLVMTSANPHGEPLVRDDAEALSRLAGIADAWLLHDRAVLQRCDDSLLQMVDGGSQWLRRARGFTPQAVKLPRSTPPLLALGGLYNSTVCVTRGDEAWLSPHIGDLDSAASCRAHDEAVAHLLDLLAVTPAAIVHDAHPDFHSTHTAQALAARLGVPALAVQHHHAHLAAVLAEHGVDPPTTGPAATGPALGLALDGVGLGEDGGIWGGELLRVAGARCTRLGHLLPVGLPGGDRAAREPWRMAASLLHALGRDEDIVERYGDEPAAPTLVQMLRSGLNTPPTSSLGRWFDGVAGLLELSRRISYEAQAAMHLEALAATVADCGNTAGLWRIEPSGRLDLRPLLAAIVDRLPQSGAPPRDEAARLAARFHDALADALADWLCSAAVREGLAGGSALLAGGGCLANRRLRRRLRQRVAERGYRLLLPRRVPPGDGGLALGQAWIAQQALHAAQESV
jgi:hydrogenase maturation protein HypF